MIFKGIASDLRADASLRYRTSTVRAQARLIFAEAPHPRGRVQR